MERPLSPAPFWPFRPGCIVPPATAHTHTAVVFHGRGSDGEEFSVELFDEDAMLSNNESLAERFPGVRWFEAHSLIDPTVQADLQRLGLHASLIHLRDIVEEEVVRLGGHADRLVLGGLGQGAAIGLWVLLDQARAGQRMGGFVGASAWLPFADSIQNVFCGAEQNHGAARGEGEAFVEMVLGPARAALARHAPSPFLSTPVFLGHGRDNLYIDVTLGEQARRVLQRIGFAVEWKEYAGAAAEGHWFKTPEQVEDMAAFLAEHVPDP